MMIMLARILGLWLLMSCMGAEIGAQLIVREQMQRAKVGEFIVAEHSKAYTLLFIHSHEGSIYTLEEITVPVQRLGKGLIAWQKWLSDHAPGNTCWVRYRLNLATGQMVDYYSFTHSSWCALGQANNLLATLLHLDFTPIPASERRKIGPSPSVATTDKRAVWQPPLILNGQAIPSIPFQAWRARWPYDNSDLAGHVVEVYFPSSTIACPTHFPYWLEVERTATRGIAGKEKIRIIDSGNDLHSPYPSLINNLSTSFLPSHDK